MSAEKTETMKAWAQTEYGEAPERLSIQEVAKPTASGKDLLVKVVAVSTNPVDGKVRSAFGAKQEGDIGSALVVGWDASGVVEEVGDEAVGFSVGDQVYFSGNVSRGGCFAQFVAVDHRLVALKPSTISHQQAAVIPLTAITAWEGFVDVLGLSPDGQSAANKTLLIINGAGGVGSIAVQLAKHVFGFSRIVATASRDETKEWVLSLGATDCISHRGDMAAQLADIGLGGGVNYIFNCTELSRNFDQLEPLAAPRARIVAITPVGAPANLDAFFNKRITFGFEFMFERSLLDDAPETQQALLTRVAKLIDEGVLRPHVRADSFYDAKDLPAILAQQDAGNSIGKLSIDFSNF